VFLEWEIEILAMLNVYRGSP